MKKSQNLLFYVVTLFVTLVAYVTAVVQLPDEVHILYVVVAGLAVCVLAQMGSDLLEEHKVQKK